MCIYKTEATHDRTGPFVPAYLSTFSTTLVARALSSEQSSEYTATKICIKAVVALMFDTQRCNKPCSKCSLRPPATLLVSTAMFSFRAVNPHRRRLETLLLSSVTKYPGGASDARSVRNTIRLFANIYDMARENQESDIKARHLHVLLYSQYFAMRYVVSERCHAETDGEMIDHLERMLGSKCETREQWHSEFLQQIKSIEPCGAKYALYESLHTRMFKLQLTAEERERFILGTVGMNGMMASKINEDIQRLRAPLDRALHVLYKYRYVSGWITSTGLVTIAAFAAVQLGRCVMG
jgi:hypothetical protein